jgi:hemolysin activation/secretion protein
VDRVVWPEEVARYRDFFSDYEQAIASERPIRAQTMERYLLLANDLPGLTFRSTLRASEENALASTMFLQLEEKPFDLKLGVDNRGTEESGPLQPSAIATFNNVLGLHEQVNVGYISALSETGITKADLHYLSFGYRQVLNPEGLTLDIHGNASWGDPSSPVLDLIEYESEGLNIYSELTYPFVRTRDWNLLGTIAFDVRNSKGRQLGNVSSRDRLRILRGELAFDRADEYDGVNQIIVTASRGIDGLGSTSNDNPEASREDGKVDFFKVTGKANRAQKLEHRFSLYGSVFGQWTDDPLLSAVECGLGGARYGRAFDPSIITGDQCLFALAELRHDFDIAGTSWSSVIDYAQVYAFADHGRIWNVDAPLGTVEEDDASSAGLGLRFGNDTISADLTAARSLESPQGPEVEDDWVGFFSIKARY